MALEPYDTCCGTILWLVKVWEGRLYSLPVRSENVEIALPRETFSDYPSNTHYMLLNLDRALSEGTDGEHGTCDQ